MRSGQISVRISRIECVSSCSQDDTLMRNHGKIKLGFYPLPVAEAIRLKNYLVCQEQFSAVDPCVGDGVAFLKLLEGALANRYGIEIDAHRVEQANGLGIHALQANTLDVRCAAES